MLAPGATATDPPPSRFCALYLEGLPREQLPVSSVLLPNLHHADLRHVPLAVARAAFAFPGVANDCVIAGDRDGLLGELDRLVDRLLAGDYFDEVLLVLDHAAGMTVAEIVGHQRFELGTIGAQHRLGERSNCVRDGGLVVGLGERRQGCGAEGEECERANLTARDRHVSSVLPNCVGRAAMLSLGAMRSIALAVP